MIDPLWTPGVTLDDVEKQVILKAFRHFGNNKSATAASLGITVKTLDSKLKRYADDAHREARAQEDAKAKRQEEIDRARGIVPPTPIAVAKPVEPDSDLPEVKAAR